MFAKILYKGETRCVQMNYLNSKSNLLIIEFANGKVWETCGCSMCQREMCVETISEEEFNVANVIEQ